MESELDILREVSARLERAGLAYMLTGAMAMNFHAQPRMTRNIDLVLDLQIGDLQTVLQLFQADFFMSKEAVEAAIRNRSTFNIIHRESVIKVDCIVRKQSEYRLQEFQRRQCVQIDAFQIWIVSKEDLIISKLDWAKGSHSEVQLSDVRNLIATGYDLDYLEHWTQHLGLYTLLTECLND